MNLTKWNTFMLQDSIKPEYGDLISSLEDIVRGQGDDTLNIPSFFQRIIMASIEANGIRFTETCYDLPRVYIALNTKGADGILNAFGSWEQSNGYRHPSRTVLRIDTKKLRIGTKFYSDEDFKPNGA